MRAPATPASSIARPRSTTTSALSPIRCAQSAPTAVAKRNPDRSRTKYEGKVTLKTRKRSGSKTLLSCDRRPAARLELRGGACGIAVCAIRALIGCSFRIRAGSCLLVSQDGHLLDDDALPFDGRLARLRWGNVWSACDRIRSLAREHVDGHEPHAHADRDVRDIECRPVPLHAP